MAELVGIRGWLAFFCVGMFISAVVWLYIGVMELVSGNPLGVIFVWVAMIPLLATIFLVQRYWWAPIYARVMLVLYLFVAVMLHEETRWFEYFALLAWLLYFFFSRRVKNTYVRAEERKRSVV